MARLEAIHGSGVILFLRFFSSFFFFSGVEFWPSQLLENPGAYLTSSQFLRPSFCCLFEPELCLRSTEVFCFSAKVRSLTITAWLEVEAFAKFCTQQVSATTLRPQLLLFFAAHRDSLALIFLSP